MKYLPVKCYSPLYRSFILVLRKFLYEYLCKRRRGAMRYASKSAMRMLRALS